MKYGAITLLRTYTDLFLYNLIVCSCLDFVITAFKTDKKLFINKIEIPLASNKAMIVYFSLNSQDRQINLY